ncbi:hypothetical protein LCGC14_0375240 [marine sediment metagenome]|uniref:Uncharacterized protein n=1 Tax=marine sediment metagenome TaxID=412755 RepID=A0A0F9TM23_9ZZZZ
MKTPALCPESKEGKPHSYSRKKGFGDLMTCDECGNVDLEVTMIEDKKALTCDECKRIRGFCSKHSPQMVVDEGVLVPRKLLEKVLQDYQQALYAAHERWGATFYAQQARLDELSTIVESDPS